MPTIRPVKPCWSRKIVSGESVSPSWSLAKQTKFWSIRSSTRTLRREKKGWWRPHTTT
ncbi:Uncharacterised protein [Bordetella pertussis]|nr:Uncharacterised protein [Bordetella pertussis]